MDNKKTHIHHGIKFLIITIVLLIICANAFAQSGSITDPNIQKTITVRHIDPNIATKVVNEIIQLKIFQLPKETLIVPNQQGKMLTAMTETPGQMKLIEEIVENIDFQITNEGTINKIYISVTNLIFDEFYRIISPLLSKEGRLSYNITAHTLVVTEITENLKNIENFATKLDSYDFVDPNSIPDAGVIDIPKQADTNSIEAKAADSNEPMVAVQFSGFKIEQITERLKQWTGKQVVPSQEAMNLIITIFAPEKMKRSEAIALLFLAIRQQGYIVEETDDTIYIKTPPFKPDTVPMIEPNEPLENIQNKDWTVRKIYKLKNEKPSTIGQLINSYLSPSGYYFADESTKTLMISDKVKNLIQIEQMIGIFDSDPNALPKGGVITPTIPDDPVIDVNLTNASINQIIETLIRWTGKAVLPSNEALGLKITLSSPEKIRQSEALNLLYAEIRKQGLIVENRNNILYIKPTSVGDPTYYQILNQDDSLDDIENNDKIVRKIYNLNNYNCIEMGKQLLVLLNPSGNISADSSTNTLMVMETVEKLKQLEPIIKKLDSHQYDPNDPMVPVNLSGSKIVQIIQTLSLWTDKKVVPSEEVKDFKVILYSPDDIMKRSEAIKLLYRAMMQQGFITEETDNTIYIKLKPSTGDRTDIVAAEDSLENIQNKDMKIRKIFNLKYSSPSIMGQLIIPYLGSSGNFTAYDSTKTLLVGDTVKNLIQIEQMIGIFDSDPNALPKRGVIYPVDPNEKAQEYHIIPIKNVDVNEIANALHSILNEIQADFTNKVAIVPLPELKSLLLFGEKECCEITMKLLNIPESPQNKLQRKTFRLMYAKPEEVKNKLEELFGVNISYDQSNKTTSADPLIATTFPSLKQIVVLAPEDKMKEIEKIIMEWDSPIDFD